MLFTEKLFVFRYCFIFIVLGPDTSSHSNREGPPKDSIPSVKGGSFIVCSGQSGN